MRRVALQRLKQNGAQQIDVTMRPYAGDIRISQFRSHVDWSSSAAAEILQNAFPLFKEFGRDGNAPVQDDHLTVTSNDHIFWFQIAIDHST